MYLPKIPYKMAKNKSQPISMRGINYTNVLSDGDIVDSKNISARSYPYITTREGRPAVTGQADDIQAMTSFQGKLVTFDGEKLYYDGNEVGTLSPGEKQFAVINTKLVIMPDKVYLDGNEIGTINSSIKSMGAWCGAHTAKFTHNTVRLYNSYLKLSGFGVTTKNRTDENGAQYGSILLPQAADVYDKQMVVVTASNHLINNKKTLKITPIKRVCAAKYTNNTRGGAAFITIDLSECSDTEIDAVVNNSSEFPTYMVFGDRVECYLNLVNGYSGGYNATTKSFIYPVSQEAIDKGGSKVEFYVADNNKLVSSAANTGYVYLQEWGNGNKNIWGYFEAETGVEDTSLIDILAVVPDWANVIGTGLGYATKLSVKTPGWIPITHRLSAEDKILIKGVTGISGIRTVKSVGGNWVDVTSTFYTEGEYPVECEVLIGRNGLPQGNFREGDFVFISGSSKTSNNKSIQVLETSLGEDDTGNYYQITTTDNAFEECDDTGIIEIERKIPDLDFICEWSNRLWGCSNKDRTIYGSSWGDPTNFFDFSYGEASSFAIGIASPEDFTACCSYGDGALFFKESKIHKVIGNSPSDYVGYAYEVEGVQRGCEKSLTIMDDVLYYKGIHGVYAYNGSPQLISQNFGNKRFYDAVAGSDGDTYYISMRDENGESYLFAFENSYGMWVLEGDIRVTDYARAGGNTYMLCDDGKIYLSAKGESEEDIEWHVQFAPFYETISGKKSYSRIVLRVELPEDSYLAIEVKTDGGLWREAGRVVGKRQGIVPVQIPINRCDRFEIKLKGRGKITIHDIVREFFVGGDK